MESPSRVVPDPADHLSERPDDGPRAAGIVLAAGAGVRMGGPKALLVTAGVPWVVRAVESLHEAGLDEIVVVLGAAPEAVDLLPSYEEARVRTVVATDWQSGPGASLRAGLTALADDESGDVSCAVITLVDLPDVGAGVVRRVVDATGVGPAALGRATFAGQPGHPVVLGRDYWHVAPQRRRSLLAGPDAQHVECGDLASGRDLDHPEQLPAYTDRHSGDRSEATDLPPTNRA